MDFTFLPRPSHPAEFIALTSISVNNDACVWERERLGEETEAPPWSMCRVLLNVQWWGLEPAINVCYVWVLNNWKGLLTEEESMYPTYSLKFCVYTIQHNQIRNFTSWNFLRIWRPQLRIWKSTRNWKYIQRAHFKLWLLIENARSSPPRTKSPLYGGKKCKSIPELTYKVLLPLVLPER